MLKKALYGDTFLSYSKKASQAFGTIPTLHSFKNNSDEFKRLTQNNRCFILRKNEQSELKSIMRLSGN
jgi:hypothetical protein